MTQCWSEGELRAYVDREMPPGDMDRLAAHLKVCPRCEARHAEFARRAVWVAEMVETLAAGPEVTRAPGRARRLVPVAAMVTIAASLVVAVWIPRHGNQNAAPSRVSVQPAQPVQALPVGVPPAVVRPPVERPVPASKPVKRRARTEYFLALDDEPFEGGVVARVAFGNDNLQADVIYDMDGRPRAIRPVK